MAGLSSNASGAKARRAENSCDFDVREPMGKPTTLGESIGICFFHFFGWIPKKQMQVMKYPRENIL